jgi:two-component system chemotaxis sensor kinase CheA
MATQKAVLNGGKYREIIFAVALFLVFDLGVLVLNFYTSYQIADDATAINLAGRQRMLSQRITKTLLSVEADIQAGRATGETLKELKGASGLFNATLAAFKEGGSVKGGDDKPVLLKKVETPEGASIIGEAEAIWAPLYAAIPSISGAGAESDASALSQAVGYARANNLKLLKLMNSLTTHLETLAKNKADKLRTIQSIGIGLALINFALVLFHFIRKLRAGDMAVEAAQKENREILDTVGEGLFLLGPDMKLGTQFSTALDGIFGHPMQAGVDFMGLLRGMVSQEIADNTRDYLELLFGGRVKESLMGDLNPLSQVEVMTSTASGETRLKHLAMQFNRVYVDGKISHLLVTVRDVTDRILLEQQLAATQQRAQTELRILLSVLSVNPAELTQFTANVRGACDDINGWLRNAKASPQMYRQMIDDIFRRVHAIKGEASALELESFVNLAHDFEDCLSPLRNRPALTGEDFLPIALHLGALQDQLLVLDTVSRKLAGHAELPQAGSESPASLWTAKLSRLAARIGEDLGKPVHVDCSAYGLDKLPAHLHKDVNDVAVQLIRNAIAHGIEPAQARVEKAKPVKGHVQVALEHTGDSEFRLLVRDDGQGLVPARIRAALEKSGRYSTAELAALNDQQVVMKLFEAGTSTAAQPGVHAGRGVGLDLVQGLIGKLNGKLNIKTRADQFTAFTVNFSVA